MTEEELQQKLIQKWGGMANMTDAQQMFLQQRLAQEQARLAQLVPLGSLPWTSEIGVGLPGGALFGGSAGIPFTRLQAQQQRRRQHGSPTQGPLRSSMFNDPPPWTGWSYLWRGCCALGALCAWAGFVLFLCWIAR
jgi:hypothetical protein